MQRRTFFGIVGAGAVAALPVSALVRPSLSPRGHSERAVSRVPSLDFLLAPLLGRSLAGGFRVASVSDIERGSVTITLARHDGARSLVQVFRRSPVSTGLATTRLLDLRWMNGGNGDRATHEAGGVAVMTLASRLRRIEAATLRAGLMAEQRASLRSLHTHEQRTTFHGGFEGASELA